MERTILNTIRALDTSDGAGVRLKRALGYNPMVRLDPFLMLDAFSSDNPDDYIAGFPPHPHRGFETVTYLMEGHMKHRDHLGNEGNLQQGLHQAVGADGGADQQRGGPVQFGAVDGEHRQEHEQPEHAQGENRCQGAGGGQFSAPQRGPGSVRHGPTSVIHKGTASVPDSIPRRVMMGRPPPESGSKPFRPVAIGQTFPATAV